MPDLPRRGKAFTAGNGSTKGARWSAASAPTTGFRMSVDRSAEQRPCVWRSGCKDPKRCGRGPCQQLIHEPEKSEAVSSNLDLDRLRKIGIDLSDYMGAPNCGRDVVRAADEIQRLQAIEVEARKVVAWLDRTEASGAHYAGLARLVRP